MKRKIFIILLVAVSALISVFAFGGCKKEQFAATFYSCNKGEIKKESFVTLKSGKWQDSTNHSGTYNIKGNDITLYTHAYGKQKVVYGSGTLEGDVLILYLYDDKGTIYITENHTHKYGEWTVDTEPTCTAVGVQSRVCACGIEDKTDIEMLPHSRSDGWNFDGNGHWLVCRDCKIVMETKAAHDSENSCTVCGYPLKLELQSQHYVVIFLSGDTHTQIVIPSEYNGKPVTAIDENAFGCSYSLKSVTIPDSIIDIGVCAFDDCISLESVTIGKKVKKIGAYAFGLCESLTDIYYNGTKTMWNAIKKEEQWDAYSGDYTIHCTDGDIVKE